MAEGDEPPRRPSGNRPRREIVVRFRNVSTRLVVDCLEGKGEKHREN